MIQVEHIYLQGALVIRPKVFTDERGYFFESFKKELWEKEGIQFPFIQDNESKSSYGVVRGLHYQIPPFAQSKLVRVIQGKVLDIIVDIRPNSPTYGQSFSVELSEDNKTQLYVPRGFAHGFVTLSETAIFSYKCDQYYSKESEGGIHPFDPKLNLDWGIPKSDISLSDKDKSAPLFGDHLSFK